MKQNEQWELAPVYDLYHAYQPSYRWVSQHALSINGKRTNITKEDLLTIGTAIRSKKAMEIIEQISTTVSQWNQFADAVKVSPHMRDAIDATLVRLL